MKRAPYPAAFKAEMVRKLTGPKAISATALSRQVGVSQSALSRWVHQAATVTVMSKSKPEKRVVPKSRRPQEWSPAEKLAVVVEAAGLADEQLGAFLRQRGLYHAQLQRWREQMLAAVAPTAGADPTPKQRRRIRALERELKRKDKALAEAAALLVLQKKLRAIWVDEDEPTTRRNGR